MVEMQSAVSAADQDQIIGVPVGRRRAITSKAVSTGVQSISSSNSGSRTKECCLKKGEIFDFSLILIIGKVIQC